MNLHRRFASPGRLALALALALLWVIPAIGAWVGWTWTAMGASAIVAACLYWWLRPSSAPQSAMRGHASALAAPPETPASARVVRLRPNPVARTVRAAAQARQRKSAQAPADWEEF